MPGEDDTWSFDSTLKPSAPKAAPTAASGLTMSGYLLRRGKKSKSTRRWYTLDQSGQLRQFKDASAKKAQNEHDVRGAMVEWDAAAAEQTMKVVIPSSKEPLILSVDGDGTLQEWTKALEAAGAHPATAPPAAPVDPTEDDAPFEMSTCCFEEFIFARGTPREKAVLPVLTGELQVAGATEQQKNGTATWAEIQMCQFRLEGAEDQTIQLDVSPVPQSEPAQASPKSNSFQKLKARASHILNDSFERGNGTLALSAAKGHEVCALEDGLLCFAVDASGSLVVTASR